MIVRYDKFNRFEKPIMTLCNPGATYTNGALTRSIGVLNDTSDEELQLNFNSTSSLSLRVYKHDYEDATQDTYFKKLFEDVKPRRMIFVEDVGFFVIGSVDSGFDGNMHYKDVSADSCEIELQNKCVPYIEDGTYQFNTGSTSNPGLLETVMASMPMWTIGTVDSAVSALYRTFEDVDEEENLLSFLLDEVQDAYECIFIFDTINRQVNVYDQNNYVHTTGIHLTKDDVINSITIQESTDDLYTAISVFGDDDVSISAVNPMGGNVIYNFDYYLDWMSSGLQAAVTSWKSRLNASSVTAYQNIGKLYNSKYLEYLEYVADEEKYTTVLDVYKRCYENIVTYSDTASAKTMISGYATSASSVLGTTDTVDTSLCTTIAQLQNVVTNKIASVNSLLSTATSNKTTALTAANGYLAQLTTIRNSVAIPGTSFTDAQYEELSNYISEGSYTDPYITFTDSMTSDEKYTQMQTLYNRAVKQLERICQPTQEFSIDTESFLFQKEFEHFASDLETGCVISVELSDDDIAGLFLSGITINYDDYKMSLKFGNRLCRFDTKSMFEDVLGNVKKSANSIEYIKDILYPVKASTYEMETALADSRNITKEAALSATNQCITIDDTGYTGRRQNDDGTTDNKQVKIVNNSIVFTNDAWSTCSTAIGEIQLDDDDSVYGINAEAIMGNIILGNRLHIGVPSVDNPDDPDEVAYMDDVIVSVDVQYAQNTSTSTAPTTGWQTTAPAWENGKYIWQRTVTTYASGNTTTSNSTCLTGATGVGIDNVVEKYGVSSSESTQPTTWHTSFSSITLDGTNKYLWNYETTSYTNGTTQDTDPVIIGTFTKGITSLTEHYLASVSGYGVTTSTSGWSTSVQTVTSSAKYLWNYETINYTDGTTQNTSPAIIGVYGDTGATGLTGKSVTSIKEQYYLSTSNASCTGGSWVDTCPEWKSGKYIWTRSYITWKNSDETTSTSTTTPTLAGAINSANETAYSKSAVTRSSNEPSGTGYKTGDLWIKTRPSGSSDTTGSVIYYYDESLNSGAGGWKQHEIGTTSIIGGSITTDQIAANSIHGDHIQAGVITADHIQASGITVGASTSDAKIKLSSSTESAISTANANASQALSDAAAKATIFKQSSTPTALAVGDLWVIPATAGSTNGSEIKYWDGSSWVLHQVGTTSIVNGSITTDQIAADVLRSNNIDLYGRMEVYTDANIDDAGGYIGYGKGNNGKTETAGIVLTSSNQNNYAIATTDGIRLQNYYTPSGGTEVDNRLYLSGGYMVYGGKGFKLEGCSIRMDLGDGMYWEDGNSSYSLCLRRVSLSGGGTAFTMGNSSFPTYLYGSDIIQWDGSNSYGVMRTPKVIYSNESLSSSFSSGYITSASNISEYNLFYIQICRSTSYTAQQGGMWVYVPGNSVTISVTYTYPYNSHEGIMQRSFTIDKSVSYSSGNNQQIYVAAGHYIDSDEDVTDGTYAIPAYILATKI